MRRRIRVLKKERAPEAASLLDEAKAIIYRQAECIKKLSQEPAWLKRQVFGSKTKRFLPSEESAALLPGFAVPVPKRKPQETKQSVAAHERSVHKESASTQIPDDLPREKRIIDIPEEQREGLKLIGYIESERVA